MQPDRSTDSYAPNARSRTARIMDPNGKIEKIGMALIFRNGILEITLNSAILRMRLQLCAVSPI